MDATSVVHCSRHRFMLYLPIHLWIYIYAYLTNIFNSKWGCIMSILLEEKIQQHTNAIISGEISPPEGCCPLCFTQPITFKLHECRRRSFRYTVGNYVKTIMSLLARWKCPACGKTFTTYPPFALPHKRYVLTDIKRLSKQYLEDEHQSYRTTVTFKGLPIGYQEKDDKNVDHFLDPSTAWRWIRWLGFNRSYANQGLHLTGHIVQHSSIFQLVPRVVSGKYRSLHRKIILQSAKALLYTEQEFQRLFGHKNFLHLATVYSRK